MKESTFVKLFTSAPSDKLDHSYKLAMSKLAMHSLAGAGKDLESLTSKYVKNTIQNLYKSNNLRSTKLVCVYIHYGLATLPEIFAKRGLPTSKQLDTHILHSNKMPPIDIVDTIEDPDKEPLYKECDIVAGLIILLHGKEFTSFAPCTYDIVAEFLLMGLKDSDQDFNVSNMSDILDKLVNSISEFILQVKMAALIVKRHKLLVYAEDDNIFNIVDNLPQEVLDECNTPLPADEYILLYKSTDAMFSEKQMSGA